MQFLSLKKGVSLRDFMKLPKDIKMLLKAVKHLDETYRQALERILKKERKGE